MVTTENYIYFERVGNNLWVSDGKAEGTQSILEANISNLKGVGNTLFFTTNHQGYGNELWKSDGTAEGT
ncbi:MAG: hypothetical protein ACFCAD_10420 [Pleurocapsa sp.]